MRVLTEFMMWGGCSPTLSTMQGGNQEPKILEAKQLGFMDNGTGKHQSNTVYNKNGLSPSITTILVVEHNRLKYVSRFLAS